MDDYEIINLIKSNPSKGLDKAIETYAPLVKTIVIRIIGSNNKQDVEECISDVFVKLWQSIDNIDLNKGSLKNYLISITRFTTIDCYRKLYKTKDVLPIDENTLFDEGELNNIVANDINSKIINEAINELGEPDKEIFIRRYFLYEPIKSISSHLGINTKQIENKLYRGKLRLKNILLNKGIII